MNNALWWRSCVMPSSGQSAGRLLWAACLSLGTALFSPEAVAQSCGPHWSTEFASAYSAGADGAVRDFEWFNDGTGSALFACGDFTTIAGRSTGSVAKWDGTNWIKVGYGCPVGAIQDMTIFDDGTGRALCVGSSSYPNITAFYKWNGIQWQSLGYWSGQLYALQAFDDGSGPALYAAGYWSSFSARVIKWNGKAWSAVGEQCYGGTAFALEVFDDGTGASLYAGGDFTTSDSWAASRIAKWNGSQWVPVGSGTNGAVRALCAFDDGTGPALYAGGDFTQAGGIDSEWLARWNGTQWAAAGSGLVPPVYDLRIVNDGSGDALFAGTYKWSGQQWNDIDGGLGNYVYAVASLSIAGEPTLVAGGSIYLANKKDACNLAALRGGKWEPFGSGGAVTGAVTSFQVLDDQFGQGLYALGTFTNVGGLQTSGLGRWSQNWYYLPFSTGSVSQVVSCLTIYDDSQGGGPMLYAAGTFTWSGYANYIAKFDGSQWWPLDGAPNAPINALAVYDDGRGPALYAASDFWMAGGLPANGIARWDGQQWEPLGVLGGGVADGEVNALAVYDDGTGPALYAGGTFDYADGWLIPALARWNGWQWSAVGDGFATSAIITSLDIVDDGSGPALYVRGTFETAGGQPARNLARWSGRGWETLGGGVNIGAKVNALAVYDNGSGPALYATGDFTRIGGVDARRIARWDGATWQSLGDYGLNAAGKSMTVFDDGTGPALYIGGDFTVAGGYVARRIARYQGQTWSVLGIGLNSGTDYSGSATVNTLAVFDDGTGPGLYVGGSFDTADGTPSLNMARWGPPAQIVITEQPAASVIVMAGSQVALSVSASGPGPLSFQWYKAGAALGDGGRISGSQTRTLTITPADPADSSYYYVMVSNACGTVPSSTTTLQVIADSDGDGVPDTSDACPNTIPGATVDAAGCPPLIPGDFNRDGDVDRDDVDYFQACATGPAMGPPAGCEAADLDQDGDVDQDDFGFFQRCLSGTNVPGHSVCGT